MKQGFFGIGNSNLGVYEYLSKKGELGDITLRSDTDIPESVARELSPERVLTGADALKHIDEDVIYLSPSVRRDREELRIAAKNGVKLSSDLELFLERRGYLDFAITGSDGKSTTTHLIAKMLTEGGMPARPTGNYGVALSSVIDTESISVAELSSFQLNFVCPTVRTAVITGITPNHLNWHSSLDEYVGAKRSVTDKAERLVADADSELIQPIIHNRIPFAAVSTALQHSELSTHVKSEHYLTYRCGVIYLDSMPFADLCGAVRRERYNVKNYMLAIGATLGKVSRDAVLRAVTEFSGLPHRSELIRELDGVRYYDSSIDSTPERTLATLGGIHGRNAVIIAGKRKKLSLFKLAESLPSMTVGCVLMGQIGAELAPLLSHCAGYRYVFASDMQEAILSARELLGGIGNVILSPAGTSFDVYKNFEERGRAFASAVMKLK